jgi:hypothetical protein
MALLDIRLVDPRVRHHEADRILGNDQGVCLANDANGLAQYQLHQPWVLAGLTGASLRLFRRHHGTKIDESALGLRHDFLRHNQHIMVVELDITSLQGFGDQLGQVVAGGNQWHVG